jgi:plastocyanin
VRLGVRVGQALRPRWGPGGEPVTSLRPGADDVVTTVPFAGGNATVKIRVDHGTYTFQCDPHATLGMKGTFDVGGVAQVGA